MQKIFDFHFHLLFKHYIADPKLKLDVDQGFKTSGVAKVLNELVGGSFDSQSSPSQVKESPLFLGVISLSSVEYAFAERILSICGNDFSFILPVKHQIFDRIKQHQTTYWKDFMGIVAQHRKSMPKLAKAPFSIEFLKRNDFKGKSIEAIESALTDGNRRSFALAIEGGHNLSDVPSGNEQSILSANPHHQMKTLQEMKDFDFMSINLCHLSDIPEQRLGGFAQGVNKLSQRAFKSDYFLPSVGLGLTELGKKLIGQCLLHPERPVLIDVKHMSLYTRLEYYRFKDRLAQDSPDVARLPVISSHTGFTFTSIDQYLNSQRYRSYVNEGDSGKEAMIEPENRKIGRTDDKINKGLYANPWTINLFDEEIAEIMASGGMMGISLDQRILGASNPAMDAVRDHYYEKEQVAYYEFKKLFKEGRLPGEEGFIQALGIAPSKEERHFMLLCMHIVHAVKVGYDKLPWHEGTSPWDHICIGSDFDGLINPINGYENITKMGKLGKDLRHYLPLADKFHLYDKDLTALRYNEDGSVNEDFLNTAIEKFTYRNGLRFIARYLTNWSEKEWETAKKNATSAEAHSS
ncbi:hypothetical protein DN752_19275 [Echinicola strongylocentroti]|uniref:Peptidase M19 n=1 Tax=Echinicola strongylocentroti TaxID=1795355 RepID=A0A2Z4INE0_9BACT|nr:membrane dipeptidase [Echinicola strongylocentroti]AWW32106.1 hypothetical protein DN752_19275 [Echinicola strongylocentroti]